MMDDQWMNTIKELKNFQINFDLIHSVSYRKYNQRKDSTYTFHDVEWNEENNTFTFKNFKLDEDQETFTNEVSSREVLKDIEIHSFSSKEMDDFSWMFSS